MESIVNAGIFTSQGFFAAIFLGVGLYLLTRGSLNRNPNTRTDKRIYIFGIVSLIAAAAFMATYVVQLKGVL